MKAHRWKSKLLVHWSDYTQNEAILLFRFLFAKLVYKLHNVPDTMNKNQEMEASQIYIALFSDKSQIVNKSHYTAHNWNGARLQPAPLGYKQLIKHASSATRRRSTSSGIFRVCCVRVQGKKKKKKDQLKRD